MSFRNDAIIWFVSAQKLNSICQERHLMDTYLKILVFSFYFLIKVKARKKIPWNCLYLLVCLWVHFLFSLALIWRHSEVLKSSILKAVKPSSFFHFLVTFWSLYCHFSVTFGIFSWELVTFLPFLCFFVLIFMVFAAINSFKHFNNAFNNEFISSRGALILIFVFASLKFK